VSIRATSFAKYDLDEDGTDYDNVILFAGYYRDPETWFYPVRNRFHEAELGRWHQRDPLRYVDGMSLYEYVRSEPATRLDLKQANSGCLNGERAGIFFGADTARRPRAA